MLHNFWLAKPYGLANKKLCYIQIGKFWRKDKECSWEWFGEYGPRYNGLWMPALAYAHVVTQ